MLIRASTLLLLVAAGAAAGRVPAETEIHARLRTAVSSGESMAGERVEAVVTAPVIVDGRIVIPAGSVLIGCLEKASPAKPGERAALALEFFELVDTTGEHRPILARLASVDNARETVDEAGIVLGTLESETLTARMDRGLERLSGRFARFAEILQAAKDAVLEKADTDITYAPGVDLKLVLSAAVDVGRAFPGPNLEAIEPEEELHAFVNAQPFRTTAENSEKPSDLTNLMFLGSREKLEAAFTEAGWTTAEKLNTRTGLETFRAVVENRGYKEAPMSTLLLDGEKAEMDFQKQLNTFAKRHHLRIWKRPETFQGHEVWLCAATHDIGISFSAESRTFIHDIDPEIDRERAKVVYDLVYTGLVKGVALVERPEVPRETENATGDEIVTDGAMAVLLLE